MEVVRDTPLEHGITYWAIEPPRASMIVVVKVTFDLRPNGFELAPTQPPVTGETFWDDDPQRSVRWPTDLAILKPRGECFVVGCARPLTGRPETQTTASFAIGAVRKSFAVFGDRTWSGDAPSAPTPFTEMPISWERAFGGPGIDDNPLGTSLPNVQLPGEHVTRRGERVRPACAGPLGMTWKARQRYVGTYDERWRTRRFPWLPEDFQHAFYNEAPADQQIDGYWQGDEPIELERLHPTSPIIRGRLPRLRPRAFVEDERGAFEEVGLVLDTIVVDADAGTASCVWRGARALGTDRLAPEGLARFFTMHEDLRAEGSRSATLEACRARMQARLEAEAAAEAAAKAASPPSPEALAAKAQAEATARAAAERAAAARAAVQPHDPQAAVDRLHQDLKLAGVDLAAIDRANAEHLPAVERRPTREEIVAALDKAGVGIPEAGLAELLDTIENPPDELPPEEPLPPADKRKEAIWHHAQQLPLEGDYAGVNLGGLDLRGLDARRAVLVDANLRGANLTNAKLDGANLARADFFGANLSGASLRKADLGRAILDQVQLAGATLDGADLGGADLGGAVMDDASLRGADLTGAILEGASLVGATCDEATFNRARMTGCRCAGASLVEARLYEVAAAQIDLDRANLSKVRVGQGADLSGATIRNAKAAQSLWRDAKLGGAALSGTVLDDADLTGADLTGAQLRGCRMRRAVLQESKLAHASLAGSDAFEAIFAGADLTGADLTGANLYSCNFHGAFGEGARTAGANVDGTYWESR